MNIPKLDTLDESQVDNLCIRLNEMFCNKVCYIKTRGGVVVTELITKIKLNKTRGLYVSNIAVIYYKNRYNKNGIDDWLHIWDTESIEEVPNDVTILFKIENDL